MDSNNIQLCPTPIFYVTKDIIAFFPERIGVGIAIVGGFFMNSTSYPLTDGTKLFVSFPHGISGVPTFIRTVLECTADDSSGIVSGQEVEIGCFGDFNFQTMVFGQMADASKIYLVYDGTPGTPNPGPPFVSINVPAFDNTLNAANPIGSFSNFSLKVYWQ